MGFEYYKTASGNFFKKIHIGKDKVLKKNYPIYFNPSTRSSIQIYELRRSGYTVIIPLVAQWLERLAVAYS